MVLNKINLEKEEEKKSPRNQVLLVLLVRQTPDPRTMLLGP
jgi:hypothetical protein